MVQGVVGHYDYLAASSNNWSTLLDRDVSVEEKAKSFFEDLQNRQNGTRERTKTQGVSLLTESNE